MRTGVAGLIRTHRIARLAVVGLAVLASRAARGQESDPRSPLAQAAQALARRSIETSFRLMNRPFEPFRLIGNVYYVGASDVSSFLITTPEGHILIDSGFAATVPLIRDGVRKLGFRFEDIRILLNSHAHVDHAGGHALLKRLTGARIVMSAADARLLAQGGRGDFLPVSEEVLAYEPAQADRIIGDGDHVTLGGVTLTAHLTPGHTQGCTTWTMVVEEAGKNHDVVFYGSTTLLPGVRLVGNPKYPGMAEDFARTFRVLKALPCDVFLGPHGSQFGLREKARRLAAGEKPNPFIDPAGYRAFLAQSEQVVAQRMERERRGSGSRHESGQGDGESRPPAGPPASAASRSQPEGREP
ncbi:MAG TPA: subclass B3 metallo-beta-lactamase [Isosphaeraceae bacterium]|nr:subclass B3 metallo-beta-lactamase [Isosphaeraceae bacterium]